MSAIQSTKHGRPTTHLAGLPIFACLRDAAVVMLVCALLPACSAPSAPPDLPLPLTPEWWVAVPPLTHESLSAVLGAISTRDRPGWDTARQATLDAYLATIARGGPSTNPELFPSPDHVLAYFVNAHIAWALALSHAPSLVGRDVSALQHEPLTVGAATLSLERLVGEVWLRAPLEPRLRLWLNPGWRGGPELPPSAVEGHAIDWQLADQAQRCGRAPGFWVLDRAALKVSVSGFTTLMWGLPDAPPQRTRRLLDLVPPPAELREAILATCGGALQRCAIVLAPFDRGRRWLPTPAPHGG
ncbi:MAG: hypothetical protein ACHQQS_15485 [Thermoanaerobaculales bacterium]